MLLRQPGGFSCRPNKRGSIPRLISFLKTDSFSFLFFNLLVVCVIKRDWNVCSLKSALQRLIMQRYKMIQVRSNSTFL